MLCEVCHDYFVELFFGFSFCFAHPALVSFALCFVQELFTAGLFNVFELIVHGHGFYFFISGDHAGHDCFDFSRGSGAVADKCGIYLPQEVCKFSEYCFQAFGRSFAVSKVELEAAGKSFVHPAPLLTFGYVEVAGFFSCHDGLFQFGKLLCPWGVAEFPCVSFVPLRPVLDFGKFCGGYIVNLCQVFKVE